MKKFLAAGATVLAVAAGSLVAAPANASYVPATPTSSTTTMVKHVYTPSQHPQAHFVVKSNRRVHGTVTAIVRNLKTGKVVGTYKTSYHSFHPMRAYTLPKAAGTRNGVVYRVVFKFTGTGFAPSRDAARFTVKK